MEVETVTDKVSVSKKPRSEKQLAWSRELGRRSQEFKRIKKEKTTFKVQDSVPKNRIVEEEEEEPAEPQSQNTDVSLRESSSNTYVYVLGLGAVILATFIMFKKLPKNVIKHERVNSAQDLRSQEHKSNNQSTMVERCSSSLTKEKKCSLFLME
ncbi:hypothetical protein [Bartonella sp. CL29QHWL]|uniref:hypothetical protein n=1 Tax=Bartonella sp. CL29QHWL TaxID=3243522 RepID=UPI0035D124E0